MNAFEAVNDYGDPTVWATLEWGGITKRSRLMKKSQLNEYFHFKLALSNQDLNGPTSNLVDAVMDELRTKPQVQISVWADTNSG